MEGEEQQELSRWQRFRRHSKENYQLVIRSDQNYKEVGSYNLTPLNIYVALSTLLLLMAVLVFLLIAFTPLRKYVPGYGDIVQRQEMNELEDIVGELTGVVDDQSVYIENLTRTLRGEATSADDIEEPTAGVDTSAIEEVSLSEEEVRLRREMALERVGETSRNSVDAGASGPTKSLEQIFFVAPLNGEISAGFRASDDHYGVDILAPLNTAVKAAADGAVFMSEYTSDNGNVIGIMHEHEVISFYKHNSRLLKKVGDRVRQGEAVAIIGNTGEQTTGPHLHFELWHAGRAIDPTNYLSF